MSSNKNFGNENQMDYSTRVESKIHWPNIILLAMANRKAVVGTDAAIKYDALPSH